MAWWRWSTQARGGAASGILGDLLEVFTPSRQHLVEEQERRRQHAQLPESGAPPQTEVRVDLDTGVAYLPEPGSRPGPAPQDHREAPAPEPGPGTAPGRQPPAR